MDLTDDLLELGGLGLHVVDLAAPRGAAPTADGVVRLGVSAQPSRLAVRPEDYDILLCGDPTAPDPWVGVEDDQLSGAVSTIVTAVERQPLASAVAAQVLRMTLSLSLADALALESLAYSMMLASSPFKAWRATTPVRRRDGDEGPRVLTTRDRDAITITLNRPAARNAFDARMRDALCEALEFAAMDPDLASVILCGSGPAFSAGGDLNEFGAAGDPGFAHAVRVLRSAARGVAELGDRVTARLHGACVGAGIEVPAAAGRVTAVADTFFQLPEVSMGLIPGAGGTATIARSVGRHRACYMAISGARIDAATALSWGLVDALDPAP